jgi:hypothetical protein
MDAMRENDVEEKVDDVCRGAKADDESVKRERKRAEIVRVYNVRCMKSSDIQGGKISVVTSEARQCSILRAKILNKDEQRSHHFERMASKS